MRLPLLAQNRHPKMAILMSLLLNISPDGKMVAGAPFLAGIVDILECAARLQTIKVFLLNIFDFLLNYKKSVILCNPVST